MCMHQGSVPTIELGWRTEEAQACFHQADAGSWPANIVNHVALKTKTGEALPTLVWNF